MKRFLPAALLILLWQPAPASQSEIAEVLAELSEITGLKTLRSVRQESMDREGLRRYLEERMREAVKPKELRAEELTLKKLGFVPPDFDLRKTTVDLLTEQAAAFYDFRKKRLYLLQSAGAGAEKALLVHELAHALADQHFRLERYIRRETSDDGAIARMAVMEGQASWLMAEYLARRTGQSLRTSPSLLDMMSRAETSQEQFPVLAQAPLYIQESLLFPYTAGIRFQHALVEELGQDAFSEAFRRPPLSSQHILHPETYRRRTQPTRPPLPELAFRRGFRTLAEGTLGELDHSVLLRQYVSLAAAGEIAPQWRGGAYRLLEHRRGRIVLQYASEWADDETAAAFMRLYQQVLEKKWRRYEALSGESGSLTGQGDDGVFVLRRQGAVVTSLEGLESAQEARAPGAAIH